MKILAVDFGLRKFGLAFSEGELAEPLMVIKNEKSAICKIARLCQELQIEKVIVGLSGGEISDQVRSFGKKLLQATQLPVVYEDETLTTKQAIAKMVEVGKRKKYRQKQEDAFAAALILQNYLDRLNGYV